MCDIGALSAVIMQLQGMHNHESSMGHGIPGPDSKQIALPTMALDRYLHFLNIDNLDAGRGSQGE